MKEYYPIIIHPDEGIPMLVEIPDLMEVETGMTQGDSIEDAFVMADNYICICKEIYEEQGKDFPKPGDLRKIKSSDPNALIVLVPVDYELYKKVQSNLCVKKNCTIPAWLEYKAREAGLNFSAILQEGLKQALGIK